MRTSLLSSFVPGLLLLAGCSGGGSGSSLSVHCGSGAQFCLVSCDLGCTELGGCSLTQIAENQTLHFIFNQTLDATSVNGSTFSLRNVSGQSPEGDLFINGNEIIFVPRITTSSGISRFGFTRNESYILTIAGNGSGGAGLKAVSGTQLNKDFTCTLTVSLGIIDLDRSPPRAELLVPSNLQGAPVDTSIVIRFSELIDTAPFVGASTSSIPIRYKLKRARSTGTAYECDPAAQPIALEGTVRVSVELHGSTPVSVISMKPSVTLPGLSCVEVEVSGDVRDLAGVACVPANFQFITEAGVIRDFDIPEDFSGPTKLDALVSSGVWSNGARPGLIGGDGRHGSFDPSIGTTVAAGVFRWNTNNMVIPGSKTLSGQPETVTDGKFYFTDMTLPAGTTILFDIPNSSVPPQFFVRGKVDIAGRIEINAPGMTNFTVKNGQNNVATNIVPGQPGGLGGVGGGRGGKGGDRSNGLIPGGNIQGGVNLNSGQPGEDVRVAAGNAYQNRATGTGGLGSALFPPSGLFTNVTLGILNVFCGQLSAGGGGGGFNVAGNPGVAQTGAVQPTSTLSGPSVGGIAFDMMPFPLASPPPGYSSLTHFLTGGSGGGGGGSHPFGTNPGSPTPVHSDTFRAGGGGSGGGGCMAVRAGSDFVVRTGAMLEAKGGPGFTFSDPGTQNSATGGLPAPGGGGSGGSWVLQSGGNLLYLGGLDTSGALGSRIANVQGILAGAQTIGGAGSPGFYRLEAGGTLTMSALAPSPAYTAGRNSGPLDDRDDVVGSASTWYTTSRIFPPDWVRYVLDVDLDNNGSVDVTFSDDPANAPAAADNLIGPVRIRFQGARVSTQTGQPLQGTTGPWRDYLRAGAGPSNINADGATGLRMMLLFNRRDFPNAVVKRLIMTYRG